MTNTGGVPDRAGRVATNIVPPIETRIVKPARVVGQLPLRVPGTVPIPTPLPRPTACGPAFFEPEGSGTRANNELGDRGRR